MMSLISKQIDDLRDYAKSRYGYLAKIINDAADTIELLSAKLSAANMEQSSAYYHGGWIPCSETKEIPTNEVVVRNKYDEKMVGYLIHMKSGWECDSDDRWMDGVVEWFPLPVPYHPEGER